MGTFWDATFKAIRDENRRRLHDVEKSLSVLKHQDSWFADDHRRIIALRREISDAIDRHAMTTALAEEG